MKFTEIDGAWQTITTPEDKREISTVPAMAQHYVPAGLVSLPTDQQLVGVMKPFIPFKIRYIKSA